MNKKLSYFLIFFGPFFINFFKDDIPDALSARRSSDMWDCGQQFDQAILSQLSSEGCLSNISRLDILLSREDLSRNLWKDFMPAMVNLLELNITVLERKST